MAIYSRSEKLKLEILDKTDNTERLNNDVELIYILEGTIDLKMNGHTTHMQSGDILLVNAGKLYQLQSSGDVLYARLSILYSMFSDIIGSLNVYFLCDSVNNPSKQYDKLRQYIEQLLKEYVKNKDGNMDFAYIANYYHIMDTLLNDFLVKPTEADNQETSDKFQKRIIRINHYIQANYDQPISLKELSQQLYLSVGYLSRFFKKTMV
ncbi:MAG: AraC family transcriptional regulator [Clostridiales bacterium]|nr:AraC family transcriptional regulator [Clostridiales bacterium]